MAALIFGAAQLVRPDFRNPGISEGMRIDENPVFTNQVRDIIKTSCADCHSFETRYPWYSRITPVNWWLKGHIDEGRDYLNFSTEMPNEDWDQICKQVKRDKMPLPSYIWGHPGAALSEDDKNALCDWSTRLADRNDEEN